MKPSHHWEKRALVIQMGLFCSGIGALSRILSTILGSHDPDLIRTHSEREDHTVGNSRDGREEQLEDVRTLKMLRFGFGMRVLHFAFHLSTLGWKAFQIEEGKILGRLDRMPFNFPKCDRCVNHFVTAWCKRDVEGS